jgi:hypothetical protein
MASSSARPVEYDVFISYRQREPDRTWVRSTLLPELKRQGFRVFIDFECFRLGAAVVDEMERAVVGSRYTVTVLTPEYLQSQFTKIENLMAEHLGLEQGRRRLIALLRSECDPGLRMRMRLWLDMTDDAQFESNMARLTSQLRMPPGEDG